MNQADKILIEHQAALSFYDSEWLRLDTGSNKTFREDMEPAALRLDKALLDIRIYSPEDPPTKSCELILKLRNGWKEWDDTYKTVGMAGHVELQSEVKKKLKDIEMEVKKYVMEKSCE